jgi:hypothetical protein
LGFVLLSSSWYSSGRTSEVIGNGRLNFARYDAAISSITFNASGRSELSKRCFIWRRVLASLTSNGFPGELRPDLR